jgi:hypothetical protein
MNEQWVSKEEAGVRLGSSDRPLSPRRVLELAKEGRLTAELVRDPNSGQMVTRINAGSVERFIYNRNTPAEIPDPAPRKPGEVSGPHASSQPSRTLAALADLLRDSPAAGSIAHPARLWLTLEESAEYSGLPASVLSGFIGDGKLSAMNVGRRRGGQWRIRRLDLEQFAG